MKDRTQRKTFERTRVLQGAFHVDLIDGAIREIIESNGKSGNIRWDFADFVPMELWEVHGLPANQVCLDGAHIEVTVRVSADFAADRESS